MRNPEARGVSKNGLIKILVERFPELAGTTDGGFLSTLRKKLRETDTPMIRAAEDALKALGENKETSHVVSERTRKRIEEREKLRKQVREHVQVVAKTGENGK